MSDANRHLSVVIPLFNEEPGVDQLFARLIPVLDQLDLPSEVLCVDDGSTDGTVDKCRAIAAKDRRVKILRLSRNFGHQAAISAGLDHATGAAVVMMDGDLQDPPEVIPAFVETWRQGYDVVYAIRRHRPENFIKRTAYWTFYRLLDRVSAVRVPRDAGDFGLLDSRVADLLRQMPERNRFLRGLRSFVGLRQTGIEVDRGERAAGQPKYTFSKLRGLAMDGVISFSYAPLKLATQLGFFASGLSFLFAIFVMVLKIGWQVDIIEGWASLMVVVAFLGGVQLITIGILGEYVGRIYDEVKRRPLYVIAERINLADGGGVPSGAGAQTVDRRI